MLQLSNVNLDLGVGGDWMSNDHFNIWEDIELPTTMEEPTSEKAAFGNTYLYYGQRERESLSLENSWPGGDRKRGNRATR